MRGHDFPFSSRVVPLSLRFASKDQRIIVGAIWLVFPLFVIMGKYEENYRTKVEESARENKWIFDPPYLHFESNRSILASL